MTALKLLKRELIINTHFSNPQGFDWADHYSSVEDLSILSHYALEKYPLIKEIVGKEFEDLTDNNTDLRFYLSNWNGLIGVYPGVFGVKTGNTRQVENTTIVCAKREK